MVYARAGFVVQTLLMDMEFNKVIPELPEVVINTSAASEHVAEVECRNRVIKERFRANLAMVPFKSIQNVIIIKFVNFYIFG